MLAIANTVMKGPKQAYLLASLLAFLTLLFSPVGLLWGAVIVLVTLRVGTQEGLKLLAVSALVNILGTLVITGSYLPALAAVMEYAAPVWAFAALLRQTQSLETTLTAIMLVVVGSILAFYLAVGNPEQWWLQVITQILEPVMTQANLDLPAEALQEFAHMLTFLMGMFMVILWFGIVLWGRWWQSRLYYPGQFQKDFYRLKLPASVVYAAIILSVAGLIFSQSTLLMDLTGVLMAGLMFQGLAIAHKVFSAKHKAWLIGLYVLLFLFPQTILILATIALLDFWFDFRKLDGETPSNG
ncbi:DUF2232 domain-containing protein [Galenea microaerophila]